MRNKTRNKYGYPIDLDKVRVSYHESPAHIRKLKHSVDFIAMEGTLVKAALGGVVVDLKSDSNIGGPEKEMEPFGNFVEIMHENGEYSEYEHLKQNGVVVKIGDKVEKGQVIGYSGSTGWIAHLGPHLHFMVGVYGKRVEDFKTLEITWDNEGNI